MWVHRPGTLRDDCGESQFLDFQLATAAPDAAHNINKAEYKPHLMKTQLKTETMQATLVEHTHDDTFWSEN